MADYLASGFGRASSNGTFVDQTGYWENANGEHLWLVGGTTYNIGADYTDPFGDVYYYSDDGITGTWEVAVSGTPPAGTVVEDAGATEGWADVQSQPRGNLFTIPAET